MGWIVLCVRAVREAVKHIVGRVVDELRVALPARHRQIAHGQRVDLVRRQRLLLGYIHLVISGGVIDHVGLKARQRILHRRWVGDVHFVAVPAAHFVTTTLQVAH